MVDISRGHNVCVVVLGDIGRSPRMEYHALSLLEEDFNVDLIGYVETKPMALLTTSQPQCVIHELHVVPATNLTPKLKLIFKTIWQALSLIITLISIRRPRFLLVQNPPAIPALIICYFYCLFMRAKFIIDWHNYSYSILALNVAGGYDSFICRLCRKAEGFFGAKAHAHICVTKAMKDDLQVKWNIGPATVLYDRAPLQFHPIDLDQKHELFVKLSKEYPQFLPKCHADLKESGVVESTALTQKLSDGSVLYKDDRPAVLISSTSWTPDEDFNTLLKALEEYEMCACQQSDKYPSILCIITGKGPQKELYMDRIAQLKWTKVNILTPWLDIGDYAGLLASADLGVCLHWSSSGLDLPMKVVDMFGSGLPVSAYNFNCLHELVVHGENGFVFESYRELADQLQYCFKHFPNNSTFLEDKKTFYRNLSQFQALRWTENWKVNAFPIFNSFI